ncbi:MAG: EAL domain-containing protein [Clostridiaceae bacterium]|nr:EAL domain-containing protein [Clostridiaceae bacterium]
MKCPNKAVEIIKKHGFVIFLTIILHVVFFLCSNFSVINTVNKILSGSSENITAQLFIFLCSASFILIISIIYSIYLNKKLNRDRNSLKNAIKTANMIVISFLEDGVILYFNENAQEKFGYEAEQVIKTFRIYDFLNTNDQLKLGKIIDSSTNATAINDFELCIRTRKGDLRHVMFNLNIQGQNNLTKVYELMGIDITDRVNSENELYAKHEELTAVYEELAASEEELKDQLDELIKQKIMLQEKDERYNLVVEASNIGIWEWDRVLDSSFYTDKWYEIFGVDKNKVKGQEQIIQEKLIHPDDMERFNTALKDYYEGRTPYFECEYRITTNDGSLRWIHSVGKALWDDDGNIIKLAGANTDITPKKEAEEKINKLAYFDTLTGLPNDLWLAEYFEKIKKRTVTNIALIYIDLENFKLINDSYGHLTGDTVMIEVSNRLKEYCNEDMVISRFRGDEFAVLAPNFSDETLEFFAEEIINHLEAIIKIDSNSLSLSANIGMAVYPRDGKSIEELIRNADTAMYRATEKKRKYLIFQPGMNDAITERLNIRNHMKLALAKNEFMLYYQPQYRSADKKIMGFEALCRWNSESLGNIPPAKFIPIAEDSKLIIPLGEWILEEAIRFLKSLHDRGHNELIMSVNISIIQLLQKNFSDKVTRFLETYGIPADCLELEITESGMMESVDLVLENIMLLKDKGVRIALDDFGTGYSSLNYLTELPLDTLKIDKSFIDNIGQEKEKSLLTGSIVEIGRRLGLSIVAEGVETENQFKYLAKKRCERIQGYFFSKPLPADEVLRLID